MKKLLLIRHAEAAFGHYGLADFDRPLTQQGQTDALEMAERLLEKGLVPEVMVSSPALRALTTAQHFARVLKMGESRLIQAPEIYEAPPSALLDAINQLDEQFDFAALVGHNPGLTMLAGSLAHSDIYNIATCGIVLIHFPFESWKMISGSTGEQILYDQP